MSAITHRFRHESRYDAGLKKLQVAIRKQCDNYWVTRVRALENDMILCHVSYTRCGLVIEQHLLVHKSELTVAPR